MQILRTNLPELPPHTSGHRVPRRANSPDAKVTGQTPWTTMDRQNWVNCGSNSEAQEERNAL